MTRRYPAYRDSGVEWLGEVPEVWDVVPIATIAEIVNGYPFDSKLFNGETGTPLIRIRDLNATEAETRYSGEIVERVLVTSDDVLIGMDGDFNVGRWLGEEPALLNQRMCCIRGKSDEITRLLEYALPVPLKLINDVTYSTTVKHLSSAQIEKSRVGLPPTKAERAAILTFLDRETAKIDALVAEQRRLIDLLKEKRQAVISHAVTRGLNPAAKLKPSGVDWLGEVPEGWNVRPLKYFVRQLDGIQMGPFGGMLTDLPQEETEYKLYGQENVISGDFARGQRWIEPKRFEELSSYRLLPGDLVMTRKGSIGNCRIFPQNAQAGIADSDTIRVRLNEELVDPALLLITLQEGHFIRVQFDLTKRGAILSGLNTSVVSNLLLPVAPLSEQAEILAFVRAETAKWEALLNEAEAAITLLQERRAALISAAVTGKIDVRDVVPQETEVA